jgi:ABC-type uncharacterized transport system permease subunit
MTGRPDAAASTSASGQGSNRLGITKAPAFLQCRFISAGCTIFDAARWPSSVFRGVLALLFTFVIPLALMTTYPALALLGRIDASRVAIALGIASAFLVLSRLAWRRAVRQYTSAGG